VKQRKKKSSLAVDQIASSKPFVPPSRPIPRIRLWTFRSIALLSPLFLFLLVEAALHLFGFGHPNLFFLRKTINGQNIWIQNDKFAERFLGREMARQPFPLTFCEVRPPNTIRVFVLGESAAFGDPQSEFGLPRMLQAILEKRFPGTQFEVINAAMTAINSHAILPIARDCPSLPGDIWVLYMGNNEVVGPYGAGTVFGPKTPRMLFVRSSLALKATRTGQLLGRILASFDKRAPARKEWGGMQMFLKSQVHQDNPRMQRVYNNFQRNLTDILSAARHKGAKIVVSTVASNLKDCAPFASQHRSNLTGTDLKKWDELNQKGVEAQQAGRFADAIEQFRQTAQIDDTFAELQFRWGQCCLALGRQDEAYQHFTRARDLDTLRFRCDTRLNEIIRTTALNHEADGVQLVDTEAAVASATRSIDNPKERPEELFYEHVHFTFEGNYLVALALAEQVAHLLPGNVVGGTKVEQHWPTLADCVRRLAWTGFSRREAASMMYSRLNDAPFTNQINHAEQMTRFRQQLENLTPATQPAGLQEAASRCREAIALSTNDWVLFSLLGRLEQRLGDFTNAAKSWQHVVDLMPYYVEAWEMFGAVLAEQKQNDSALAAFDHALEIEPESLNARTGKGQILASEGKYEEAAENFESALKMKPYWGPAHLGLARALDAMGKKQDAEVHFREALSDRINTPAAYKVLAQVSFEKGWLDQAVRNFNDALRLDPSDATTHLNLGITLGKLNRQSEARFHYAEAARLDPNLAEAHARLGLELGRQGDNTEALEHFSEAVRLKPDYLEARLNLGIALVKQQRNAEALDQFQEVLRRNPTNAVAQKYVTALESARATSHP
jgi:tetratricopeptide (TPR) repeat protein